MTLIKLTSYSFVYVMQIARLVFCKYPLITCTFPKKCKKNKIYHPLHEAKDTKLVDYSGLFRPSITILEIIL